MRLFAHRLAIAIGEADVSGLLNSLPHSQWLDWIAYFEREPWGEARADTRSAIVAALLYNRTARADSRRKVQDFMAHRTAAERAESTAEHIAALKRALRAGGGKADADINQPNG